MSSQDRREYVKYIGGAVVGAVIVGAYSAINPSTVETTVTKENTVTNTATKTETAQADVVTETATKTVGADETATVTEQETVTAEGQTITKEQIVTQTQTETEVVTEVDESSIVKNPGNVIYQAVDPYTHGDPPLIWAGGVGGINYHVYDRLFRYGNSNSPVAWLVDTYEKNADGTEWTFTLKDGVKFHSGNNLEAKDVKWSLERASFHKHPASGILHPMFDTDKGDTIEVVDRLTFKMTMSAPALSLPFALGEDGTAIVDSETVIPHVPEEGETKGVALQWLMENEAGSGPWLVKEQQEGIKTVFERWDDYYFAPAKVKHWTLLVVKEAATAQSMLEKGDIDILSRPPLALVEEITKKPGIKIIRTGVTAGLINLLYDHTNEFTSQVKVRQALSYATPVDSIVEGVVFGIGKKASSWSIDGMVGWIAPSENPYNLNIPKAKALLAEAGYPDGADIGKSTWGSFLSAFGDMATLVQEQWDKIGVSCEHLGLDDGPRWAMFFNHELAFNWSSWLLATHATFTSLPFYFTLDPEGGVDDMGAAGGEYGASNFIWWKSEGDQATTFANTIKNSQNLAERNRAITDWQRLAVNEVAITFIYHQEFPFIARDWVTVDYVNMSARPLLPRPYEWGWQKAE